MEIISQFSSGAGLEKFRNFILKISKLFAMVD